MNAYEELKSLFEALKEANIKIDESLRFDGRQSEFMLDIQAQNRVNLNKLEALINKIDLTAEQLALACKNHGGFTVDKSLNYTIQTPYCSSGRADGIIIYGFANRDAIIADTKQMLTHLLLDPKAEGVGAWKRGSIEVVYDEVKIFTGPNREDECAKFAIEHDQEAYYSSDKGVIYVQEEEV